MQYLSHGLETMMPGIKPWVSIVAERIHQVYNIQINNVFHSTKETADPNFRSSQHSISLTAHPVEREDQPPVGMEPQLDITSLLAYRPELFGPRLTPQLGDEWQFHSELIQGMYVHNLDFVVDRAGNKYRLIARPFQDHTPLNIPAHGLAKYLAGYNQIMHQQTAPEMSASTQGVSQHRMQMGYRILYEGLYIILSHNCDPFTFIKA